jgi:hypothetical protein
MTAYKKICPKVGDGEALGFSEERQKHKWFSVLSLVDPAMPMLPDDVERGTGDYGMTLAWHGPHAIDRARQFHIYLEEKGVPMLRGNSTYTPPYNGPIKNMASNVIRYHLIGSVETISGTRATFTPTTAPTGTRTDEFVCVRPTYR